MAKKNLTLLMDGFMGEAQTSSVTQQQSIQGKSASQEESQDVKPRNDDVNHAKETQSMVIKTTEQMKSRLKPSAKKM